MYEIIPAILVIGFIALILVASRMNERGMVPPPEGATSQAVPPTNGISPMTHRREFRSATRGDLKGRVAEFRGPNGRVIAGVVVRGRYRLKISCAGNMYYRWRCSGPGGILSIA